MSVNIKLKHSAVNGKAPLPGDLTDGELALNTNAASPAAYIKDSAGAIVQLAGAGSVSTPDASETVKGIAQIATTAEITAGTDDLKFVTPAKLAAGVPAATETKAGRVELATAAETTTGTDKTRAVHPAGLKVELDKKVKKAGDTMTGDLDMNDGSSDVITLDVSAGSVTATDGTKSVVVKKDGTVVATGDIQGTSHNGGQLAGFRNQIINGDFRVYQRGEIDNISSGEFLADRWLVRLPSGVVNKGPNWNFDINAYMLGYVLASSVTGWTAHVQKIEAQNIRPFEGKEVTVSCYSSFLPYLFIEAKDNSGSSQTLVNFAQMTEIEDIGSGVKRYSHTFVPSVTGGRFNGTDPTALGMQVAFTPASSSGATVAAGRYDLSLAQLEPGPVATPFEHRPIGTELALCQRYYQTFSTVTMTVAAPDINTRYLEIPRSPAMRADPTETGTSDRGTLVFAGRFDRIRIESNGVNSNQLSRLTSYTADAEL